jgi:tartrate dehydratase beta subunit/fumarate hydratase class I family protein
MKKAEEGYKAVAAEPTTSMRVEMYERCDPGVWYVG